MPAKYGCDYDKLCKINSAVRFFTNPEDDPEEYIKALTELAPKAYAPKKKLSRVFRALCDALGITDNTAGSDFQRLFAQIADELATRPETFQLFVSLNPAHWLTMSNPKEDLRGSTMVSCHSFNSTEYSFNCGCTGYARDTTSFIVNNGLELPSMINAGMMWNHKGQLKLGVDYSLQTWGKTKFPDFQGTGNQQVYALNDHYFQNRHRVIVGGEWCKNTMGRNFLDRMRFRGGVSYSTPYLNINGNDGPKEFSVSAGFGIPIVNTYNNRSILNISGQWARLSGKGLVEENTFRINVGITFNERWFMKWKVE